MTAVPVIYDGTGRPPPEQRPLRAGPLELVYEAGDLRYVRLGRREVCRRWYAAVRDADWNTVPGVITDEVIEEHPDSFRVRYTSTHRRANIHFVWRTEITGSGDGAIRFVFDGEARSSFRRNRIGFCVLHPIKECAGARAKLRHPDGSTTETEFPRLIAPQNPFKELAGLSHEVEPGVWVDWTFEGDVFETEDQRNWTDASFKTFCTPLRLPFPVEVPAGARVRQVVTLAIRGTAPAEPRGEPPAVFEVTPESTRTLPAVGLCVAGHGEPLTREEIVRLSALRPSHLRVDLDLSDPGSPDRVTAATAQATELGAGLEIGLTLPEDPGPEIDRFGRVWEVAAGSVTSFRWLVYRKGTWSADRDGVRGLVRGLGLGDQFQPVCAGTPANFAELNRGRPPVDLLDGVCFSVHPQVHAFDNRSLVETCAALADVVESARAFSGPLPLHVTPVTLKGRVNPYATGPAPPVPPGELPPQVDVRQVSLFGAGWTLAALKYLAETGVASVTFYETTGWLGVMERVSGCPLPDEFPSRPGTVYPLYHVLADAAPVAGARVRRCASSDALAFDGLAFARGDVLHVRLANLTDRRRTVTVTGLGGYTHWRVLDEETARRDPGVFRSGPRGGATPAGTLDLDLPPYAYAWMKSGPRT